MSPITAGPLSVPTGRLRKRPQIILDEFPAPCSQPFGPVVPRDAQRSRFGAKLAAAMA